MIVIASADSYVYGVVGVSDDQHKLHAGRPLHLEIGLKVIDSYGMNSVFLRSLSKEKNWAGGLSK